MPEIEIEMIEPREPSVEYIREMIDDADQKLKEFFSNKDATPRDINDEYFWIKQQLADLIAVNNMLKKKEKEGPKDIDKEIVDTLLKKLEEPF